MSTNIVATIFTGAVSRAYQPQFIIAPNVATYGPYIRFDVISLGTISAGTFNIVSPYWRPATDEEIATRPIANL
jgi:hypothetical protein